MTSISENEWASEFALESDIDPIYSSQSNTRVISDLFLSPLNPPKIGTLLGHTEPRIWTRPLRPLTPETSRGYDAIEWIHGNLNIELLPHQEWLFIHLLELNLDNETYRFRTALCLMGRQSTKSTFAMLLTIWRMIEDGADLCVGTSAVIDTALEMFLKTCAMVADSETLAPLFRKPRLANGQQCLTALNGARYKIVAANRRASRSLSAQLVLLDEIREHSTFEAWAAISKTTNAQRKGMRLCLSNAGDDTSVVLNHLRSVAIAGNDPTVGIFEWSADDDAAIDDRMQWAKGQPTLGRLVTEETLAGDLATDPPEIFRTEVMCQRVQKLDSLFDMVAWTDCEDPAGSLASMRGRLAAGIDVSPDLAHAALLVAGVGTDGRVRVEVAGAWLGVPAARTALPGLLAAIRPRAFGVPPGPAIGALGIDLRKHPKLKKLTATQTAEACSGFVEQVAARQIRHTGDPLLTAHVGGAQKAPSGDSYKYQRTDGGHVSAAYAAAVAVYLARQLPKPAKLKVVSAG
jgi:hypothetical protein